ncbi:MAG: hypothetical protein AB7F32_12485 [Victivallaceae bacterium]
MNIQSGKVRGARPRGKGNGSIGGKLATAFRVTLLLVVVGALVNSYIYLNQKIAETGRTIRLTEKKIHETEREIANLRVRREQLSAWPHISSQMARFKLTLAAPDPRQVRKLAILAPGPAPVLPQVAQNNAPVSPAAAAIATRRVVR